MKLAFCLFNYFPYGGLQRDFLRIAKACLSAGHEVHVYTMSWEGEEEPGIKLHCIPVNAWQNHSRIKQFANQLQRKLEKEKFDCVVGFNKIPGLDVYYAADVCYQARAREKHGFLYRLLPRYREFVSLESSVFEPGQKTKILLISPLQKSAFQHYYQTEDERFVLLPPGIDRNRLAGQDSKIFRHSIRNEWGLSESDLCLLMVGSGFKTKGLDRAIRGLAALPEDVKVRTHLFIAGQDKASAFEQQAERLGVRDRVHFLGGRDDVPALLQAADLLVHPAYHENTGTVLLEAMAAGLAVLTVDVCGYAHYVKEGRAGMVLDSPFDQCVFDSALQTMLLSTQRRVWGESGRQFAAKEDIYSLPEKAVTVIEAVGIKK